MRTFFTFSMALMVVASIAQKKPKINQAKSALDKGDYAVAKSIVDEGIVHEKTKNDPMTWYIRGQVYAALDTANNEEGALEESIKAFDKTLVLDPEQKKINEIDFTTGSITNVDSKKQEYYGFYYNKAVEDYQAESFESAATNFENAYFIMPSDTNAILNAAYAASAIEDDERAKRNYEEAIKAGNTDVGVFLRLYNYATAEEDLDKAYSILEDARVLHPDDVDLQKFQVSILIKQDKTEEAKEGLENAIKSEPENADLFFTLGVLNEESGDEEGALEAYSKAIEIEPEHFNSNYNLGVMAYNKVGSLIKEQGALNYYPGKPRPDPKEKKRYEELDNEIQTALKNALPFWEKLYGIDSSDENVVNTLEDIKKRIE